MTVTYFLLLSSLAVITQAQNCSRPIAGENMNLKDQYILEKTFPHNSNVAFACNVGYQSAGGSPVITCTAGSWSPVRLKCERKNCGPLEEVDNGNIDYSEGTHFGDKVVITCNPGFTLVGKSEILCEDKGWANRIPQCEVVTCEPPPQVVNGIFSPNKESYEYNDVVQYSCHKDFALSGPKSISCSEDGEFHPAPPTCIMVECEDRDIENGDFFEGSRPPHRYKSTVTYRCRSGFTMIGERTQTCELDGQWHPGLPKCQRVSVTTKATTTTTTTTTTRPLSKKPPGPADPTITPGNNGDNLSLGLGIGLTVLIVVLTICGCYFCGVPKIIKKKRGSRGGFPENVVPKDGEDVALS